MRRHDLKVVVAGRRSPNNVEITAETRFVVDGGVTTKLLVMPVLAPVAISGIDRVSARQAARRGRASATSFLLEPWWLCLLGYRFGCNRRRA